MLTRLSIITLILTGSLIITTEFAQAEQNTAIYLAKSSALENSHRNARDKNNATLTPEDQKANKNDIRITSYIRRTLVRNKSLSIDAQNIKIITRSGRVTLRGPLKIRAERKKLKKIAQHTRGVIQVNNQLEIKAP